MRSVIFIGLMVGCSGLLSELDTTPAKLSYNEPDSVIVDERAFPLSAVVLNKSGRKLDEQSRQLSYSATPSGIVDVGSGSVKCLDTGDASVIISGAGMSKTFSVKCRLVESFSFSKNTMLLVGEPGGEVAVKALDKKGKSIDDVPITLKTKTPDIVDVQGSVARGLSVGNGVVIASAGSKYVEIPIAVYERTLTDSLSIPDGGTVSYTLVRGRYVVEVNVRATDGSSYGVTISDTSGGCRSRGEGTRHKVECSVSTTTTLLINNPTSWGLGPGEMGNITIYKVP